MVDPMERLRDGVNILWTKYENSKTFWNSQNVDEIWREYYKDCQEVVEFNKYMLWALVDHEDYADIYVNDCKQRIQEYIRQQQDTCLDQVLQQIIEFHEQLYLENMYYHYGSNWETLCNQFQESNNFSFETFIHRQGYSSKFRRWRAPYKRT